MPDDKSKLYIPTVPWLPSNIDWTATTRLDENKRQILIMVLNDRGPHPGLLGGIDQVALKAYIEYMVNRWEVERNAHVTVWGSNILDNIVADDLYTMTFSLSLAGVISRVSKGSLFDEIQFLVHGNTDTGAWFIGGFDPRLVTDELPLKEDGVIVLVGCYSKYGPFYDWCVKQVGGDEKRVKAFTSGAVLYYNPDTKQLDRTTAIIEIENFENQYAPKAAGIKK